MFPQTQHSETLHSGVCQQFARAGLTKRLIHLKKHKLVFFSPRSSDQSIISFPTMTWKNEKRAATSHISPHPCAVGKPTGSLMSNLCPGDISSLVTRSERARTSLIKHPDCLVLLYYHLSLPTASQVRPEAQNPENELTSLFWLIDPDFGAIGERTRAWSSAALSAKYHSSVTAQSSAGAVWLCLPNVLSL